MTRALLVSLGLITVATGTTPFDLAGVHVSSDPLIEITLCALIIVGLLVVNSD